MTIKYMDVAAVILALVGCNISIISGVCGTGYSTTYVPLSIFGHRFNQKVKKCLKVELILVGSNLFLLILYFIAETTAQGAGQIGAVWHYFISKVAWGAGIIIILAAAVFYFFIRVRQDIYSGEELDLKYIKLTDEVGTDRDIYIIAGDFGFLGRVPKNTVEGFDQCAQSLKKLIKTHRPECDYCSDSEKCGACIMKKEQFKQLVRKANEKTANLKILCRRPKSEEEEYQITMGYFMELFHRLKIRFYTGPEGKCPDLPLRGRIIGTAQNSQKMFSHFVKQKNQYQELVDCDTDSSKGRTYIGLYSALWQVAAEDPNRISRYRNQYKSYIAQAGQERHEPDDQG